MIKINEKVVWDNKPGAIQSEEAYEWFRENVYPLMAQNKESMEGIQPTYDKFGRPIMWIIPIDDVIIKIDREYINPDKPTWSKKQDIITIKGDSI